MLAFAGLFPIEARFFQADCLKRFEYGAFAQLDETKRAREISSNARVEDIAAFGVGSMWYGEKKGKRHRTLRKSQEDGQWQGQRRFWRCPCQAKSGHEGCMLYYSLILLVVAILAAALGFAFLAGVAAVIAKIFFIVFLILFAITLFRGGTRIG